MSDEQDWPFDQAPDVAALTTRQVLEGALIQQATHYADDHSWGFFCGTTDDSEDGRVVSMRGMLDHDKTLVEVADLQPGWSAWRTEPSGPWKRYPDPSA